METGDHRISRRHRQRCDDNSSHDARESNRVRLYSARLEQIIGCGKIKNPNENEKTRHIHIILVRTRSYAREWIHGVRYDMSGISYYLHHS